jgi:hypothetical protein
LLLGGKLGSSLRSPVRREASEPSEPVSCQLLHTRPFNLRCRKLRFVGLLCDDLTTESRESEATILAGLSVLLVKTGFSFSVGRRLPAVKRCSALHGDKCSHKSPPEVLAESADDADAHTLRTRGHTKGGLSLARGNMTGRYREGRNGKVLYGNFHSPHCNVARQGTHVHSGPRPPRGQERESALVWGPISQMGTETERTRSQTNGERLASGLRVACCLDTPAQRRGSE